MCGPVMAELEGLSKGATAAETTRARDSAKTGKRNLAKVTEGAK